MQLPEKIKEVENTRHKQGKRNRIPSKIRAVAKMLSRALWLERRPVEQEGGVKTSLGQLHSPSARNVFCSLSP